MIVSFFHHGKVKNETGGRSGGGGDVKNYLLGTDEDPRTGATLILGNADDTTEVINSIKNNKIYTSGVLSFSKEENITADNKFKIMQSFTDTLFPDFEQDRVSGYWVEHRDKDRLELHFVFADIDLLTGKALPVYYHGKDLALVDSWKNITNFEYGLIDPNDPKHKRLLAPTSDKDLKKQDTKKSDWDRKEEIHNWLLNEIEQNEHIQSRADIIKHLEKSGYEVTRASKKDNTISIKNPDGGRNLKLKGALYDPKFDRNYSLEQATADYQANQQKRIEQQYAEYEIELDRRKTRLQQRFGYIDRTPLDNALTRELDEIRNVGTNSFIEATHQFINEHDLSAREQDKRISDSFERANTNTAIQPVGNSAFERYHSKSAERATFTSDITQKTSDIERSISSAERQIDEIKQRADDSERRIDFNKRAAGNNAKRNKTITPTIENNPKRAGNNAGRVEKITNPTLYITRRIADSEQRIEDSQHEFSVTASERERRISDRDTGIRGTLQQIGESTQRIATIKQERLNNPIYRTPKDLFRFFVNLLTPARKKSNQEKGTGSNLVAIDYAFEQYQANKELQPYDDYSIGGDGYSYVTNVYNLKSTAEAVFSTVAGAFRKNNKSIIEDYRNISVIAFCKKYNLPLDNKQIEKYHAENPRFTLTPNQAQQSVEDLTGFKMTVVFNPNRANAKEKLTVAEFNRVRQHGHTNYPNHDGRLFFDTAGMLWEANQIDNPSLRELNKFLADNCNRQDVRENMSTNNIQQFLDKYFIENVNIAEVLAHAPKQTIQVSEPTPPVLDTPQPTINRPKPKQ